MACGGVVVVGAFGGVAPAAWSGGWYGLIDEDTLDMLLIFCLFLLFIVECNYIRCIGWNWSNFSSEWNYEEEFTLS